MKKIIKTPKMVFTGVEKKAKDVDSKNVDTEALSKSIDKKKKAFKKGKTEK